MEISVRLSKVENDLKVVVSQQELILNKLTSIERCLSYQFPWFQPYPQQQIQGCTPQRQLQVPSTYTPQEQQGAPINLDHSASLQHYPSTPSGFVAPPTSILQTSLPPGFSTTTKQLKKIKTTEKALPSTSIQESLSDNDDVIASYPNHKGAKLPTLAMKLAKEAVFGEKILKQCTPLGGRGLPGLPTAELNNLKEILFRHSPQFWGNTAEFESVWSDCIECIGQACI